MNIRKIHYLSGLTIAVFAGLHLFNHSVSVLGAAKHIEVMSMLRHFYRNIVVETILLLAVAAQVYSGLKLFNAKKKTAKTFLEKLHVWTGLYLAMFFIIHISAVLAGRHLLKLDTNFYFGVAGLNHFPVNLFFIPYYALAIISFFGHIAAIHGQKMQQPLFGITPTDQSNLILAFGFGLTLVIFYGLTNHFQGFQIPEEYQVLIGKFENIK